LNPGIPEGRTYFLKLIEQLAIKYQPDGIHLDDYFYPYEGMAMKMRLPLKNMDQTKLFMNGGKVISIRWLKKLAIY